jgi:thioredoxin 1
MKEVLKFYADWCGPCKMLSKTIENLKHNEVPIREVDIDEQTDLAVQYNIRSVPTMVLLKDGAEISRVTGAISLEKVKEFLNG